MTLFDEILNDKQNELYTQAGLSPLYSTPTTAKLLIIGQAPSKKVQDTGIMWDDASGDRLREWLGITKNLFYNSGQIAVIPMDFYYPGKAKSGDKPPRKDIAEKWHVRLIKQMPDIKLTILIGAYAQRYYLKLPRKMTTTATVKNYQEYLPKYFPIVHPSPRNNIWLKKNPWFGEQVIPALQENVAKILN